MTRRGTIPGGGVYVPRGSLRRVIRRLLVTLSVPGLIYLCIMCVIPHRRSNLTIEMCDCCKNVPCLSG